MFFILLIFFLTIVLSTLTVIPIIIPVLLCFTVIFKKPWVFFAAFASGLLIDLLILRILGTTALFLLIFTGLVLLYQRRFEIQTFSFVAIASFLGSIIYFWIFNGTYLLLGALVNSLIAIVVFKILRKSFLKLV